MTEGKPARVRFAPSPTGRFHIGSARTALYDYLLARQSEGQFILRIEDTDRNRFDPQAENEYYEALRWLGLDWDEGPDIGGPFSPYRQSERTEIYRQLTEELIDGGHAYYCFCTPERLTQVRQLQQKRKEPTRYDGLCRRLSPEDARERALGGERHVVRFKTPQEGQTTAVDFLRGPIKVDNHTIDDYILVKSSGMPVYHLAAMADDHLMEITHVLRGSEWLPTFPLHVLIYEAFGWEQPIWIHLSVLLNPSGKGKLSKRSTVDPKSGAKAVFVNDLREMGYLPQAVINWISLMGWSYDDHSEFFPIDDLIGKFSIEKLSPSPAAVNFSKLDHFNGLYIRSLSTDELAEELLPFFTKAEIDADLTEIKVLVPLIQERIRTLDEAVDMAGFFFQPDVHPESSELVGKKMSAQDSARAAERAHEVIQALSESEFEQLEGALRDLADELGIKAGQLFGILRVAVTGQKVSPPLIESMVIIGKKIVLARIERAAKILNSLE
ncbi:MAG: glutamate--tRNA ligase [Anaerolineales bacterium]|nr:MAG: glutamate--tRNA ligase [Anaerolineales bacterium]